MSYKITPKRPLISEDEIINERGIPSFKKYIELAIERHLVSAASSNFRIIHEVKGHTTFLDPLFNGRIYHFKSVQAAEEFIDIFYRKLNRQGTIFILQSVRQSD